MNKVYLGIDIGTTTICGAAIGEDGRFLTSLTKDNGFLSTGIPCEKLQSPDAIVETVFEIVREMRDKFNIVGIGLSGQMHGILYVDRDGRAVSPLYSWQDGRGGLLCRDGKSYADIIGAKPGYGGATHFFLTDKGLLSRRAVKLCTIGDYAAMCLCGGSEPVCDVTNAASLGLFDLHKGAFDTDRIIENGMDPGFFPTVAPSFSRVGKTKNGIPVYNCIGDNQAGFLGAVEDKANSVLVNVGTGSQVSLYTDKPLSVPKTELRPFPGGGYLVVGASLCGGRAYAMLERFYEEVLTLAGCKVKMELYEIMERKMYSASLNDPPAVRPTFCGTREDPTLRGAIMSLTEENFHPVPLAYGMLCGIVGELYEMYAPVEAIVGPRRTIVGSGNGVRLNCVMQSVIGKVFGGKVCIPVYEEEAACGAAKAARIGSECN